MSSRASRYRGGALALAIGQGHGEHRRNRVATEADDEAAFRRHRRQTPVKRHRGSRHGGAEHESALHEFAGELERVGDGWCRHKARRSRLRLQNDRASFETRLTALLMPRFSSS